MPFKDPIQRKQYHKNYYETKQKNQPKKELTPPTPTEDAEYSDKDDIEIQSKNKISVDTEYDQFLHNKEYIPYPPHIQPFIQNNLRNIQPIRPMIQQHNQNLPTHFTFV